MAGLLCIVTPAGMDDMFREIGRPVSAGTVLPASVPTAEGIAKMKDMVERYGMELFPPDYFSKQARS
jgi:hypothetical protein